MSEDLEREPDGVPHDIVGRITFATCVVAILTLAGLVAGGYVVAAIAVVLVTPAIVFALRRKSDRERDHVHPSR